MYTNPTFVPTLETKMVTVSLFHQGERLRNIFSEDSEVTSLTTTCDYICICLCILQIQEQPCMGNFLIWCTYERCLESVTLTTWEINSRVVTKILLKLMLLFLFCDWLQSSESCIVHPPTCTELGCMLLSPAIYQANITMNGEMHNGLGETGLIHLMILK